MNENQEAQALARWLEEHPGEAPPPDVDPEVIEALYALRPDLAPAPNVHIDDIFAAVESGPFAKGAEEEMITEEVVSLAAERAKRVPNDAVVASPPAVRRVRWWSAPGIGALAAAALALVIILPTAGILLTQKTAPLDVGTESPVELSHPKGGSVTEPSVSASPAPQPEPPPAPPAESPARRDTSELLRQEAKKSDAMEDDRDVAGALATPPADAAKPAAAAPSTVEGPAEPVQTEGFDDREEQALLEKQQADAKTKSEEAEPAKEMESYAAGAAAPSASSAGKSSRAKDVAPAAPPAAESEYQVIGAAAADESSTPAPYGDISAASTVEALVAATDDSDDRKAMTAAWFLAQRQYENGDPDAAMATIAKGLRRTGNDDLRSDLTALQWTVAQSRPTAAPAATDQ